MRFLKNKELVIHLFCGLVIVACCGIIVLEIWSRFLRNGIWDDAFMFGRYADNLMAYGKLSWNPGGDPTYGLTSILFMGVVLPIRVLFPLNPVVTASVSSLLCGFVFLGLLIFLMDRFTDASAATKHWLMLFALFSVAATPAAGQLAAHFTSGMDTMFAMAFLTAYILICKRYESSPTKVSAVLMGVWGGLALFARPDLALYSLVLPASLILMEPDGEKKRYAGVALVITISVIVMQMALASRYLGSVLPLSFYAKGSNLYGAYISEQYRGVPFGEFIYYVRSYWPFLLIIAVYSIIYSREWRAETTAIEKGLIIATALFIAYYLFGALQIMHYHQRFYYPTLPAIIFVAVQSATKLIKNLLQERVTTRPRPAWALIIPFALALLVPRYLQVARDIRVSLLSGAYTRLDILENYRIRWSDNWFCLDKFSALPDDLIIATTEVGFPAAMNPEKTVIDLTGLNETHFARNGFSADVLFEKYQPDLLYIPHPHYKPMIQQILENPSFLGEYEYFHDESLGPLGYKKSPLAIWRTSKYYGAMRAIIMDNI